MLMYLVAVLFLSLSSAFQPNSHRFSRLAAFTTKSLQMNSFYDISEKDANGNVVNFSKFKGKVVYGVNVASKCGYTASGYSLLQRISALKDQGVEVALFPCNQVMNNMFVFLYLVRSIS